MVRQRGNRSDGAPHISLSAIRLYKLGCLHRNSLIDLSTGPKFDAFFHEGPHGYHDAVRQNWNYVRFNAIQHDEFLVCWRGEAPLEIFEVPPFLTNAPPPRPIINI